MKKSDSYSELREQLHSSIRLCRKASEARLLLNSKFKENRFRDTMGDYSIWVFGRMYSEDEYFDQVERVIEERKRGVGR